MPVYNAKNFDLHAFARKAQRLAWAHAADAKLIEIKVSPVLAEGVVDLTHELAKWNLTRFRFRSAKAAARTPCVVSVDVYATRVVARMEYGDPCNQPFAPPPRCSMKHVRDTVTLRHHGRELGPATVTYSASGWHWYGNTSSIIPDDCR